MKRTTVPLAVLSLLFLTSCGQTEDPEPTPTPTATSPAPAAAELLAPPKLKVIADTAGDGFLMWGQRRQELTGSPLQVTFNREPALGDIFMVSDAGGGTASCRVVYAGRVLAEDEDTGTARCVINTSNHPRYSRPGG